MEHNQEDYREAMEEIQVPRLVETEGREIEGDINHDEDEEDMLEAGLIRGFRCPDCGSTDVQEEDALCAECHNVREEYLKEMYEEDRELYGEN